MGSISIGIQIDNLGFVAHFQWESMCYIGIEQFAFLTKIQTRISEKSRKKIIPLSCRKIVKTQFLGVVEFPSIFWIQFFKVVGFPSNFWIQFFKVVEFPSDFWIFVRNVTNSFHSFLKVLYHYRRVILTRDTKTILPHCGSARCIVRFGVLNRAYPSWMAPCKLGKIY